MVRIIFFFFSFFVSSCSSMYDVQCTYKECFRPVSDNDKLVLWIDKSLREQPTHLADDYYIINLGNHN